MLRGNPNFAMTPTPLAGRPAHRRDVSTLHITPSIADPGRRTTFHVKHAPRHRPAARTVTATPVVATGFGNHRAHLR